MARCFLLRHRKFVILHFPPNNPLFPKQKTGASEYTLQSTYQGLQNFNPALPLDLSRNVSGPCFAYESVGKKAMVSPFALQARRGFAESMPVWETVFGSTLSKQTARVDN